MKEFLTNKDLLKIWDSYDAYYFANKYGEVSTHKDEFNRLYGLLGNYDMPNRALDWMRHCYDCYYKNEYENKDNSNPFYYLQCVLNDLQKNHPGRCSGKVEMAKHYYDINEK